jgi:hypothetical protein
MREDTGVIFLAIVIIVLIAVLGIILIYQSTLPIAECEIQTAEIKIANIKSMKMENEISGKGSSVFGIGYGFVGKRPYYYVYKETKPDQYLLERFDALNVSLIEDDSQPRIAYLYEYFVVKGKAKAITINGIRYEPNRLSEYNINRETYKIIKNNTNNPEYKPLAEMLSLDPGETLYVSSASPHIKLYVPKKTIKVEYETDIE